MISQILKFALEVIVVAFIAHYVAQKMEKAIDTKDTQAVKFSKNFELRYHLSVNHASCTILMGH